MADQTRHPAFVETTLEALTTIDRIMTPPESGPAKASPSALYAYAVDPAYDPAPALLDILDHDAAVQADFERLLSNNARYHMPRVAAASSGDIERREAEGCRIAFRPSKADPEQIYVIIETHADAASAPEMLFIRFTDGRTRRTTLPRPQNGRIQLLLERHSETAEGLLDINTEVYLK